MHELSMRNRHWCQKMKVSALFEELKIEQIPDIWTIYKTHNKFLAHELKMRLKLLNYAFKLF